MALKHSLDPEKIVSIRPHFLGDFKVVTTNDGSPTACFGDGETMHSMRGAFSETVYIYGTALDRALNRTGAEGVSVTNDSSREFPRTLSLGLGLGYVEILATAYALKAGVSVTGESFELVDDLTESFRAWLSAQPEVLVPHTVYDEIATRTSNLTGVSVTAIRDALARAVERGDWKLRPAMTLQTQFTDKFQCVAFDAFSSKSTPELWSREFLDSFLDTACDKPCVLSTYACTGHLKRALVDAGFILEIREGYASKRDSTLASR